MIKNELNGYALSHVIPNSPLMDAHLEGLEILKGHDLTPEEFEWCLMDNDFIEHIQEWCNKKKCNQVLITRSSS